MKKRSPYLILAVVVGMLPAAALAAGVVETALTQAQAALVSVVAAVLVGVMFGWLAGRVDARAKVALAKIEADRTFVDRAAIELDRRLDEIDRKHLETVIDNVLNANLDRVLAGMGVPPKAAADGFVDDLYTALRDRNAALADRVEVYLDRDKAKDLIAAGIGRIVVKAGAAADHIDLSRG